MLKNNLILIILQKEFVALFSFFSPYFTAFSRLAKNYEPIMITVILLLGFLWISYWSIKIYLSWKELEKPVTLFEVAPPSSTEQSSFATTQLFSSVHGVLRQRSWLLRLFDVAKSYAFEITSTKEKGIRYILRVSNDDAQIIKKNLIAYLPGLQIKEIDDYLHPRLNNGHIINIRLANHFAFPLKKQDNLKEYDPISYITGTMTKLAADELVAVQVIVSPVNQSISKIIGHLQLLFLRNKDVLTELQGNNKLRLIILPIIYLFLRILLFPIGLLVLVFTGGREGPILPITSLNSKFSDNIYTLSYV